MGKHSGVLPLSPTKLQTRISGIKEKQATLVGARWPEAIEYQVVDGREGWMSELKQQ